MNEQRPPSRLLTSGDTVPAELGDFRATSSREERRELMHATVENQHRTLRDLVTLRRARHLTQQDVADAIGVHQSTVARFEGSTADPTLAQVAMYAVAVGARVTCTVRCATPAVEVTRLEAHTFPLSTPASTPAPPTCVPVRLSSGTTYSIGAPA